MWRGPRSLVATVLMSTLGCGASVDLPGDPDAHEALVPGAPYLVKDIVPGFESSRPLSRVNVNGTLFFTAFDRLHGWELWRSDGTEAGTQIVKDIHPSTAGGCGRCPSPPMPRQLARVGRRLFFYATDEPHGSELWVSDGTEQGTHVVKDIALGPVSSLYDLLDIVDFNGTAIFAASNGPSGAELWRSDGTVAGTRLVKDIRPGPDFGMLPFGQRSGGSKVYFEGDDGTHGSEPWVTDGTPGATYLLRDINRLSFNERLAGGSGPSGFTPLPPTGRVYFTAYDGLESDLWSTDGTPAGTARTKKLPHGLKAILAESAGRLLLYVEDAATGRELWSSDGTEAGTGLIKDIRPGPAGSNPSHAVSFGDFALFAAEDAEHGIELWRSDGTEAGTFLVKDIRSGRASSNPSEFVRAGNKIYFQAAEGPCALWMTDGTEAGTMPVPGGGEICPHGLTVSGRHLFFDAFVDGLGSELWAIELRQP